MWWLVVVEELCVGGEISSQHMVSSLWPGLSPLELVMRDAACYANNCPQSPGECRTVHFSPFFLSPLSRPEDCYNKNNSD